MISGANVTGRSKKKHGEWLAGETIFTISKESNKGGRPRLSYSEGNERLKRKLASEVSSEQNNDTMLLVHAATISAQNSEQQDLKFVLKNATASPTRAAKIKKIITSELKSPIPLTPQESLVFLLENDLTKQQYMNMRLLNKSRNSDIYPAYNKLIECKLQCSPEEMKASGSVAEVPLQNLLDHTAKRICILQKEVVAQLTGVNEAKLVASYGFDGSTGQSMFKQKFNEDAPESLDQSLFVTSIIPLKLIAMPNKIIWLNRTPQSIRFCRPKKIEFVKETKDHILSEKSCLDHEISTLKPFEWSLENGTKLIVNYDLNMTLIDGKVLNIITETKSTQSCAVCGANPKQFMTITNLKSAVFQPKPNTLKYGVSPLHAWIRFLEFVLHLSYRIHIRKWQIRSLEDKEQLNKRKLEIQKNFWNKMGLHIDKPKGNGSGTTNDGNTSRKGFSEVELFASITNIDMDFLKSLHIILISISCEYQINIKKFDEFCMKTADLYFKKYNWYPMSATLHKILVHSSQIMESCVVPVGCLGENASECRNKFYKRDRIEHARKDSRIHNMTDVFNRAMDSSDPLLSSIQLSERDKNKIRKKLPHEVLQLLEVPEAPINCDIQSSSSHALNNDDNDFFIEDFEMLPEYSFELEVDDTILD